MGVCSLHLTQPSQIEKLPFTNNFPELFNETTEHDIANLMKKTGVEPTKLQEQTPPTNRFLILVNPGRLCRPWNSGRPLEHE